MVALSYGLERTAWRLVEGDPVERAVAGDLLVGAIAVIERREAEHVAWLRGEA